MRIAGTVSESIVDGPGLRLTVFTQGCPHHCPGCHNPQTHDPAGGREETTTALLARYTADPLLDGLTISGGEPMEQAAECAALAEAVHALGGNVWVYTGWRYEALVQESDPARRGCLQRPTCSWTDRMSSRSALWSCAGAAAGTSASST